MTKPGTVTKPDGSKWAVSPVNGSLLPLGNHPGNTGGKPGRSGRPSVEFKAFLAELRDDPEAQSALATAAKDPNSRGFAAAWKYLTDYDTEKPAARSEKSVNINTPPEVFEARFVAMVEHLVARRHEGMLALLQRVAGAGEGTLA